MTLSITESVTKEAIAMLIDLAQSGEIDPWDVQVIDVVDRFLSRLISDDRKDLYESGQALLYASMLVLLKANTLSQSQLVLEEENDSDPEQLDFFDQASFSSGLPSDLENQIRRRPVALPPTARRITLEELITQIEEISALVEQKSGKRPRARPATKISRQAAMRTIAHLAHKENLSEMVIEIEKFFLRNPLLYCQEGIEISDLAQVFGDRVGVFWGLLFLSAQSKVELFQSDFYGKIQVVPLVTETAEVV
jgi:segregation and condensation protein A